MNCTKLYRPVNKVELDLIQATDWKKFPPRLPDQPIFYPVTNQEYTSQITRELNLPFYKNGFVTEFELDNKYLSKFKIEKVGLDHHTELWVPADQLEEFNGEIINSIQVIEGYHQNPKIFYVFVEAIIERTKEIEIGFKFINSSLQIKLTEKKSIGGLNLKNYLTHARKSEDVDSISWLVKVLKKDFEESPIKNHTVVEFELN